MRSASHVCGTTTSGMSQVRPPSAAADVLWTLVGPLVTINILLLPLPPPPLMAGQPVPIASCLWCDVNPSRPPHPPSISRPPRLAL
jgi:hypothetical protein